MKKTIKTAMRSVVLCAMLLTLVLLVGCGSELSGKWRSTSEKETQLAFSSTGRVTMSADGIELSGTYTTEGENLTMVMSAPDGNTYNIEAKYTIEDKTLTLENNKGQVETFIR